jgi:hypothetical protein
LKFLEFLNTCWKTGSIPDEWKGAVISSIFKKKATEQNAVTVEARTKYMQK